jgi:signal transduction histidine kinase
MSHELRTPLNAIGGYTELLEMGIHGPVTEAQRTALTRIQQSQRHLLGLINEVLNHTRIESGRVNYRMTRVPLAASLAAAGSLIMPQVRHKGLTYELKECSEALAVYADPEKLRQILLNLLTNSVKFTRPGGHIMVGCTTAGGMVSIAVSDTGIGIEAEKLSTIFDPFVQVNQLLTRPQEGIGLGLAISRDLARGMSGDMSVESERGVGSTFTLTLKAA